MLPELVSILIHAESYWTKTWYISPSMCPHPNFFLVMPAFFLTHLKGDLDLNIFPWYLELPINFISTMVLVLDLLRQMEKWIHLGSKVKQQKIKVGVPIGTFTYATTPSYLDRKRWSSGIELLLEEVCAAEDQTWTYTFVHMLGNGIISDWQPLFKNIHCYLILCICSTQISLLLWHHYEIYYKWPRSASYNNIVVLIHHYKGFIMGKLLYHGKIL